LAGLGGKRCEAVLKLLRKKLTEGHADGAWLDKAVLGHQVTHSCCWAKAQLHHDSDVSFVA